MINIIPQVTEIDRCSDVVCLLCEGETSVKFIQGGKKITMALQYFNVVFI